MYKVPFEPFEPVLGTLTEEYEAIQLLDEVDDLEDGELVSDIDESILDEPKPVLAPTLPSCFNCDAVVGSIYTYKCKSNTSHVFCIKWAYSSMKESKYCPSGERCNLPGKAKPWHWTKEVLNNCSRIYLSMERLFNEEQLIEIQMGTLKWEYEHK